MAPAVGARNASLGHRTTTMKAPIWFKAGREISHLRKQRSHEGSNYRTVYEDARQPFLPQRTHLRRQRIRFPGPVHLQGRRRDVGHGLFQIAGQRARTGKRPGDRYFRDASKLADMILSGGYEAIAGVPREEILMKYENK